MGQDFSVTVTLLFEGKIVRLSSPTLLGAVDGRVLLNEKDLDVAESDCYAMQTSLLR